MGDARSTMEEALRLLGTPQLGTFLMPAEREVVLHAVSYACETEDWKRRALSAEAKLERLRETLNGTPAPARKEDAPPPGAPPPNVQDAGGCTCGAVTGLTKDDWRKRTGDGVIHRRTGPCYAELGLDERNLLCKCGHGRSRHADYETFCVGDGEIGPPAKGNCWCLKFQPRAESPQGAEHGATGPYSAVLHVQTPSGASAGGVPPVLRAGEGADGHDAAGVCAAQPGEDGRPAQAAGGEGRCGEGGAGDVAEKEPHEEPGADGKQVAGDDGLRIARENPEAHGEVQDREAGAGRLAGDDSAEGGPPTPAGVAKWGRVAAPGAAWHLWQEGAAEAECGEVADSDVVMLPDGDPLPQPGETCLDCTDVWMERLRAAAANPSPAPAADPKPTCDGINKSAGVRCGTTRIFVVRDGKHFCKRHGKAKEAAETPSGRAANV